MTEPDEDNEETRITIRIQKAKRDNWDKAIENNTVHETDRSDLIRNSVDMRLEGELITPKHLETLTEKAAKATPELGEQPAEIRSLRDKIDRLQHDIHDATTATINLQQYDDLQTKIDNALPTYSKLHPLPDSLPGLHIKDRTQPIQNNEQARRYSSTEAWSERHDIRPRTADILLHELERRRDDIISIRIIDQSLSDGSNTIPNKIWAKTDAKAPAAPQAVYRHPSDDDEDDATIINEPSEDDNGDDEDDDTDDDTDRSELPWTTDTSTDDKPERF